MRSLPAGVLRSGSLLRASSTVAQSQSHANRRNSATTASSPLNFPHTGFLCASKFRIFAVFLASARLSPSSWREVLCDLSFLNRAACETCTPVCLFSKGEVWRSGLRLRRRKLWKIFWSGRPDLNRGPPAPKDWPHKESTSYTEWHRLRLNATTYQSVAVTEGCATLNNT